MRISQFNSFLLYIFLLTYIHLYVDCTAALKCTECVLVLLIKNAIIYADSCGNNKKDERNLFLVEENIKKTDKYVYVYIL